MTMEKILADLKEIVRATNVPIFMAQQPPPLRRTLRRTFRRPWNEPDILILDYVDVGPRRKET